MEVNTGEVLSLSESIRSINGNISSAYEAVTSAMSELNGAWGGAAGGKALSVFYEMPNRAVEMQFQALEEYAVFLQRRVSEGYEQVEMFNTSLSDAFK